MKKASDPHLLSAGSVCVSADETGENGRENNFVHA
jgi:hypothetical protein